MVFSKKLVLEEEVTGQRWHLRAEHRALNIKVWITSYDPPVNN